MRLYLLSSTLIRRTLPCLAVAAGLCLALPASADEPTYGIRVYELFQRGPRLVLAERTARTFKPHNIRNVMLGEVFPPENQPPIKVYKSRDHIDYFGSYWREDGRNEFGLYEVEVWEVDEAQDSGIGLVRIRLVERSEAGRSPKRRVWHPEHDAEQRMGRESR